LETHLIVRTVIFQSIFVWNVTEAFTQLRHRLFVDVLSEVETGAVDVQRASLRTLHLRSNYSDHCSRVDSAVHSLSCCVVAEGFKTVLNCNETMYLCQENADQINNKRGATHFDQHVLRRPTSKCSLVTTSRKNIYMICICRHN